MCQHCQNSLQIHPAPPNHIAGLKFSAQQVWNIILAPQWLTNHDSKPLFQFAIVFHLAGGCLDRVNDCVGSTLTSWQDECSAFDMAVMVSQVFSRQLPQLLQHNFDVKTLFCSFFNIILASWKFEKMHAIEFCVVPKVLNWSWGQGHCPSIPLCNLTRSMSKVLPHEGNTPKLPKGALLFDPVGGVP